MGILPFLHGTDDFVFFIVQYYYEPGTGRMFRSLVSVQRHLMEGKRDVSRTKKAKSKNENTVSN